jgi:hypothetical protein
MTIKHTCRDTRPGSLLFCGPIRAGCSSPLTRPTLCWDWVGISFVYEDLAEAKRSLAKLAQLDLKWPVSVTGGDCKRSFQRFKQKWGS